MVCQACHRPGLTMLCPECRSRLRRVPERILPGGHRLLAAFEHGGPAQIMVHHLKYRGVGGYPELVAEVLAGSVPELPIVPVPRALSRRLRYGVDPAHRLAEVLANRVGVPVLDLLAAPLHTPRRAGGDHRRPVRRFRLRRQPPSRVVVIDDVVTTGATVLAAIAAIGPERVAQVLAANMVLKTSTLRGPEPTGTLIWPQC